MKDQVQEVNEIVGKRIRDIRKAKGVSQVELANELGLAYQQVQKYETGKNRISAGCLFAVAAILDVNVQQFYPMYPFKVTSWKAERN